MSSCSCHATNATCAPHRRLHKPAQQTVLPGSAVPALLGPLPISKLKGLGGKFGEQVRGGVMVRDGDSDDESGLRVR